MPTLPLSFKKYSKFIVAVLGVLAMLLSQGLLTGNAAAVVSAILAVATALGVYQVPNVSPAAAAKPLSVATYATNSGTTWTTVGTTTVTPLLGVVIPVEPVTFPVATDDATTVVLPPTAVEAQPEIPTPTDPETPA